MTFADFAHNYTEKAGWSVIPCMARGKVALGKWEPYQQTIATPAQVTSWFEPRPPRADPNIAIVTGDVSGRLLVVDFDRWDCFLTWFHETRLDTLAVRTGKGVHLYYQITGDAPKRNWKFYVHGVYAGEIRYNGGYVIAPPSIHPSGQEYMWTRAPLRTVTLDDLALEHKAGAVPPHVWQINKKNAARSAYLLKTVPREKWQKANAGEIKHPAAYARAAVNRELDKLDRTGSGGRNTQLYASALKLAKYSRILPEVELMSLLVETAKMTGLSEHEAIHTVKSGWKHGKENGILKPV